MIQTVLLILGFLSDNFSIPIQNSIISMSVFNFPRDTRNSGDVQVECDSRTISVQIKTENPFVGTVFVKDFASDRVCSSRGTGRLSAFLEFEIGLCGALRQRILNPKGTQVKTTVTISFHPYFITKIDRTYHIVCLYKESQSTVSSGISVDEITAASVTRNLSMPDCSYQVHRNKFLNE